MLNFIKSHVSSFTFLNITQFLGALNDNVYKLLIVFFCIDISGTEASNTILATTGAIFVSPFLLFSSSSGTLADRCSKRNIIILTKLLEFVTMSLGVVAFRYESQLSSYGILFLMATQSALFGPSKYGILPEIVATEKIPKANGLMTSFTFLAIIFGTFFASFLMDLTGRDYIFTSLFCVALSLIGVFTSFGIEYTPPADSHRKLNPNILGEVYRTLKVAKKEPSLLAAIIGSAFFLFCASFVQLNIIPFAIQSLNLNDTQGGYLFLLVALGIGTGSIVAGKISGKTVELALVPISGIGLCACLYLLDFFSFNILACIPTLIVLGFFGGSFDIPLHSFIQMASPSKLRGQIVATTNFLSFFGVLCSSGLLFFISNVLEIKPNAAFSLIGSLSLLVTIAFSFQFFDYLTRFIGMILSRLHFQTNLYGQDNIPPSPAIYVCKHTAWNDTLLLLGAQRRRMRFFIDNEHDHSKLLLRLYRLLRIVRIPSIEPLEKNRECLEVIKKTLKRGISVCILFTEADVEQEIDNLKESYSFREILDESHFPIIPVAIEKGEKNSLSPFFERLLKKFRVPANIAFGSVIPARFHNQIGYNDTDEYCFNYD